jgi:hypothetical protein
MAAPPLVPRDVLNRGAASLTGELRKAPLMDVMAAARFNANSADMFQPLD